MSKLRGQAKEEFLQRMARGRRKAARANPKKKNAGPRSKRKSKKAMKSFFPRGLKFKKRKGNPLALFASKGEAQRYAASIPGSRVFQAAGGGYAVAYDAEAKGRNGRRRNQDEDSIEAAAAKFEEFHGKPPERIVEYDQALRYHGNLAEMGKLKELRFDLDSLNRDFPLAGFKDCQAVCTPDGMNIYFVGGDQRIDFEALNIGTDKDMVELGPARRIVYDTVKGFHDFEQINYWHLFGEEDGIVPVLAYDRLNHTLFLLGGNYRVRPEGIVN
jgi:hypothetical protein